MKFCKKTLDKSYHFIGISIILTLVISLGAYGQQDVSEYQERLAKGKDRV
jgi:hypothetical protein